MLSKRFGGVDFPGDSGADKMFWVKLAVLSGVGFT